MHRCRNGLYRRSRLCASGKLYLLPRLRVPETHFDVSSELVAGFEQCVNRQLLAEVQESSRRALS